jgi:alkylhydroperoxidase family enzyme
MDASDVEGLRAHGLSDRDITDAVHNIAFFAYITRVAEGLGVELEPFMQGGGENVPPGAPVEG